MVNGKNQFQANVPVALSQNCQQSLTDKAISEMTGNPRHGDAAFAVWLLLFTYTRRF